jgi:hypothetical protein
MRVVTAGMGRVRRLYHYQGRSKSTMRHLCPTMPATLPTRCDRSASPIRGDAAVAQHGTRGGRLQGFRAALRAAGCSRLFEEKASGGRWDRPELHRLLDHLRDGGGLQSSMLRPLHNAPTARVSEPMACRNGSLGTHPIPIKVSRTARSSGVRGSVPRTSLSRALPMWIGVAQR